ncbi:histone H3-like centromeric protein cid [Drosophila innubila]|uniref:histone H3-like centromeric protein cid n=1 Tax=Drosophila innubila TaxID=198719 RepID=UPI00148CA269|nr:histone H3-like centromeric protein cid [Drosophila innubila]
MRPRTTRTPGKAKPKGKAQSEPTSSPSDDDFQSPDREDETDYGLDFTTSRLTTPRRLPSSTMNKFQKSRQSELESYEDESNEDENDENQSPANSPTRRTSERITLLNNTKDNSGRNSIQPTQAPQQRKAPKAPTRRKQKRPEHRLKKLQREIVRLQANTGFLIPRLPFSRLVREIMAGLTLSVFMITEGALEALQTSTEMYLTQRFEDAYLLTQFRSRVTLEVRDMALVAYFCRTYGNN